MAPRQLSADGAERDGIGKAIGTFARPPGKVSPRFANLEKLLRGAEGQIRSSRASGIIALDISVIINPDDSLVLSEDEGAQFIRDVLDGTHPVPSNVVIRHRYSDDWKAMEPYPLLDEALNVFSLSVNTAQPEDWPVYVAKLENDFAKRETGAGRVKTVP